MGERGPDHLTVWHNGRVLLLLPEVARTLGLTDGQSVDAATNWRAIDLNVAAMRARLDPLPPNNPHNQAVARCLDATETVVARHYARTESR